MSDEFDDFRNRMYERGDLIRELRSQGAVDLDIQRGAGFAAKSRIVRKAHQGAGSGTYIGGDHLEFYLDRRGER